MSASGFALVTDAVCVLSSVVLDAGFVSESELGAGVSFAGVSLLLASVPADFGASAVCWFRSTAGGLAAFWSSGLSGRIKNLSASVSLPIKSG